MNERTEEGLCPDMDWRKEGLTNRALSWSRITVPQQQGKWQLWPVNVNHQNVRSWAVHRQTIRKSQRK